MENCEIIPLIDCQEYIPQLAILNYERLSKFWNPSASVERAEQNLIRHSNKDKLPLTLVAVCDGQPVGMASLRENDGIRPDLTPWLGGLVVDPNYRGRQIGERLIGAVKDLAKRFGFSTLYLLAFDPTIPDWYGRLGWRGIGTDELYNHPVAVMDIAI